MQSLVNISKPVDPPNGTELPSELDNMFIVGSTGVSIDYLFASPAVARAKINEALTGIDSFDEVFVNFTDAGQFFKLSNRQDATVDDEAAILAVITGYYDETGNWVDW